MTTKFQKLLTAGIIIAVLIVIYVVQARVRTAFIITEAGEIMHERLDLAERIVKGCDDHRESLGRSDGYDDCEKANDFRDFANELNPPKQLQGLVDNFQTLSPAISDYLVKSVRYVNSQGEQEQIPQYSGEEILQMIQAARNELSPIVARPQ